MDASSAAARPSGDGEVPGSEDVLHNHRGERLMFTHRPASPSDALEVRAFYLPDDDPPPRHFHPSQHETFEVRSGALKVWIGDDEPFVATAGDRFDVAPGVVHAMTADGDAPCSFDWRIEPAQRSERMFRGLWGINAERPARLGELARVLMRHGREFQLERPPRWLQVPLFATLGTIQIVRGWFRRRDGAR